jgi:hypothetical protein
MRNSQRCDTDLQIDWQVPIWTFPLIRENVYFACGPVWVRNLVSDIKGGTHTEGVWEQGAEENIWTEERWSDGTLEETAQ